MHNCGKHFPGHGFVRADSHHEIPFDDRPLDRILADDARPYEWLGGALASVMPGARDLPPGRRAPGRLLARWLREILRNQLGFDGAIFSDDLSMAGARRIGGSEVTYAEAAALALSAGCDLVLLCNQSIDGGAAVDALLDELLAAEAAGGWQADPDSDVRRLDLLPQTGAHCLGRPHARRRLPALARAAALAADKRKGAAGGPAAPLVQPRRPRGLASRAASSRTAA
jgi:beta-N-acetylhexosaminidase